MKKIIGIIIITALIAGAGWYAWKQSKGTTIVTEASAVAATVNDKAITGKEVNDQIAQITAYRKLNFFNLDSDAQQQIYNEALNTLIRAEVLDQAVTATGISVAADDINASIDANIAAAGGEAAFIDALTAQDKDMKDFRREIKDGLLNQAYFNQTLDLTSITASEEEIRAQFDAWVQNATAANEPIPVFEQARSIIEAEIVGLKREEMIRTHIDQLLAEAVIKKT